MNSLRCQLAVYASFATVSVGSGGCQFAAAATVKSANCQLSTADCFPWVQLLKLQIANCQPQIALAGCQD
jgi:hypothetical protein